MRSTFITRITSLRVALMTDTRDSTKSNKCSFISHILDTVTSMQLVYYSFENDAKQPYKIQAHTKPAE